MLFGKSYLLSLVFSWLLPKGLEWLEKAADEHKAELKSFIEGIVPGTLFDELAWSFVEQNLPVLFGIAKALLGKTGAPANMPQAIAECVAECKDKVGDVA